MEEGNCFNLYGDIESSLYDGRQLENDHESEDSYSSSSESVEEEYWDVDADEINNESTLELPSGDSSPNVSGSSRSIIFDQSNDSNALKVFSLFLLLWASFYNVSANAL